MRRIALGLGLLLTGSWANWAAGQELRWQPAVDRPAASLGKPQPLGRTARGAADDMPAMAVPEPGTPLPQQAPPVPYYYYPPPPPPPPGYYPYYPPPPGYAPPGYAPSPMAYSPAPVQYTANLESPPSAPVRTTSLKGDAVNRTSFSSRSKSTSFSVEETSQDWCECVGGWFKDCFNNENRHTFESDHAFDSMFASPVTNPFLFEDPRSLTELRPIFIWQKIPNSNPVTQGGSIYFYGTQARVALTERWSFTMNKLGGISINPDDASGLGDASGLAELHLGPKFTFVRNPESGTVAALGIIFQIPVGPAKVFQDTGDFSMVPYLSFAQSFGRSSYGSFSFMDTFGYSFQVGSGRSDFFYNSFNLGYDVGNQHKFYPFVELNWFHYTMSGNLNPVNQEGRDLANIGGTDVSGNDYLTIAPGFRYKFTEKAQFGIAAEFPLTNPKDFQDFRLTVDFIFRY